ncbi:MAG: hypothetical protein ACRDVG_06340 [Jatrophihabitantaceae bacterium]
MIPVLAGKIAVAGATAAAIVGVGTVALATSGPDPTAGAGSSTSQHGGKHHGEHALRRALRHALHGSVTTKGKDGYVTHSAVRGTVSALSATSITVKATDGFTESFTLTKDTKVRERVPNAPRGSRTSPGTMSQVKSGDQVAVLGKAPEKSTTAPTATVILDGLRTK